MHKFPTTRFLVSSFALFLLFTVSLFAQAFGTVDPYSVKLKAYKGQSNTDVYMTFSSSNPAKYSIPAELKKLQLKIRNAAGDVVFLHNEKGLALTGNLLVSSVPGVNQHNKVEIQAHIKTAQTKNEEIVRGTVVAQLRPDLKVFNVVAPAEVKINQPFQVEAVIKETNLEVGAVCDVSLYKGTTLFGTVPGVNVPAAGTVSVVFEGVTHSLVESKEFLVKISNANPGEYSTTNNSYNFTVNFTNPVVTQAMNYSMQYYGYKNYNYLHNYSNNYYNESYQETAPQMESFSYSTYLENPNTLPSGNVSEFSFKIETEDGLFRQFSASNLTVTYSYDDYYGYSYKQYEFSVPDSKITGYVYEYNYYGYTQVGSGINQWASNRVYTRNYNGQIDYQYIETTPESWFINADQLLKVSTLMTYSNTSYGGGASLNIAPYQNYNYSWSGSYWDWYYGYVNYYGQQNYDYSYNYGYGTTDPSMVPSIQSGNKNALALISKLEDVPTKFSLDQNYPNPFNPTTNIRFAIPEAGNVVLKIYNIAGEEVATLVNRQMNAGYHSVNFNASGLASGMYIYRLQSHNYVQTNKMMLMK